MAIIYINDTKYNVDISKNLLETCLFLGIDVPYFCWHPALGSVGVCRLCAVKQYFSADDDIGKIVMSCTLSIVENMRISTVDFEVQKFRKGIIELIMTNHPHDCPICEEGGNCHLQDMTVMNNHYHRRHTFAKRTHNNQYLGSFISHQMNRCIGCYRCVRYYKDYAGGTDFGVYGISNNIYFGRFQDGDLQNEYSGNLIEVCPTGVFTDKLYSKNYNRKWDLQYSPSICQHCSIGCNISVGERYGRLNRIENRYHKHINRYFLCDLGRFGYGYANLMDRIYQPVQNIRFEKEIYIDSTQSISLITNILKYSSKVIGIGSVRSSIENNFSLRKLVGKNNFSTGMSNIDHNCIKLIIDILQNSGIYVPTLREIESYDTILIIGEDITQSSSLMALSIRQAMKKNNIDQNAFKNIPEWHSAAILNISHVNKKSLYIIYSHETRLDDLSGLSYFGSVQDQENFVHAISNIINNLPEVVNHVSSVFKKEISIISDALCSSKKPLIISGSHSGSINLVKFATNIAQGLRVLNKNVGLVFLTPGVNSLGVGMLSDLSLENVIDKCISSEVDTLIVLENDLYRHSMSRDIDLALKKVKHFIIFDHQLNKTVQKSTLFFPTSNFAEGSGTVVNYEGRAQRFFSTFNPMTYNPNSFIQEGWKWIYKIYFSIHNISNKNIYLDDVVREYVKDISFFCQIKYLAPGANFRIVGQKIARFPHRASSRTAFYSKVSIHEPGQIKDQDTMFSFSMEGIQNIQNNSEYIPFFWSPGWNSSQSSNKYIGKINSFNSGIRLFKKNDKNTKYFFDFLKIKNISKVDWNIIPYYLLFGSEEMSYYSPEINQKCSKVYVLINIAYESILDLKKYSMIEFDCLGEIFKFSFKFSNKLPLRHIGLPIGFPGLPRSLIGNSVKRVRGII
ncbi:NADH-quinone oxidoreductase subunit NuoG [Buchnera aphidicola]|uniref:NADH-quinone oxidoreductase subunit NuoG n=1 Tax=Buchnera aphidicola TaxID=9 RepID=UPI0034642AEE